MQPEAIITIENTSNTDERLSSKLLKLIKGERGETLRALYHYVRWIDNVVDESDLSLEEKKQFMYRQISIVNGDVSEIPQLTSQEQAFVLIDFDDYEKTKIFEQIKLVFESFLSDIDHTSTSGLKIKTIEEAYAYNIKAAFTSLEILSLIVNGRSCLATPQFLNMVNCLNTLACFKDLIEDTSRGLFLIGLSEDKILQLVESGFRDDLVDAALDERLREIRKEFLKNSAAIFSLDIPAVQKISFFLLSFRTYFRYGTKPPPSQTEMKLKFQSEYP